MRDGARIVVRRHGNPSGPRLVLCHGNGFAIDAYLPFWTHLTDRFDLVLYDQRNHGQNPRHDVTAHRVENFVDDMDLLLDRLPETFGAKPTVGLFHSISAITAIKHAQDRGWRWDGLILFDPPLIPSPGHELYELARKFELGLSDWAKTRPDQFSSPDELAEIFAKTKSLGKWAPGVHQLMAKAILRQDHPGGTWALACPREGESHIYAQNAALDLTPRLGELGKTVKFICSDPDDRYALAPGPVNRAMHQIFGHHYEAVPGTGHLLQVEEPAACARIATAFIDQLEIG